MHFIITCYRKNSHDMPLHSQVFNCKGLGELFLKYTAAKGLRFVHKVEVSIIIDTWYKPGVEQ